MMNMFMSKETDDAIGESVELGRDLLKSNDIAKFCEAEGGPDKVIEFLSASESISTISSILLTSQKILKFLVTSFTVLRLVLMCVLTVCFFWVTPPASSIWCAIILSAVLLAAIVAFIFIPMVNYYCEGKLESINPKVDFYKARSAECKMVLDNFGGRDAIVSYLARSYPNIVEKIDIVIDGLYKKWGVK